MVIWIFPFQGTFAKLGKANISFVMSGRLAIRIEHHGSHWTDFMESET
jgi:hypothetical protein